MEQASSKLIDKMWQLCTTMMSLVGCFILFAENSQILLKISVIPILLTFIYLVAVKQPTQLMIQLNSSLGHTVDTKNATK